MFLVVVYISEMSIMFVLFFFKFVVVGLADELESKSCSKKVCYISVLVFLSKE